MKEELHQIFISFLLQVPIYDHKPSEPSTIEKILGNLAAFFDYWNISADTHFYHNLHFCNRSKKE